MTRINRTRLGHTIVVGKEENLFLKRGRCHTEVTHTYFTYLTYAKLPSLFGVCDSTEHASSTHLPSINGVLLAGCERTKVSGTYKHR